jgi:hypothetical protein
LLNSLTYSQNNGWSSNVRARPLFHLRAIGSRRLTKEASQDVLRGSFVLARSLSNAVVGDCNADPSRGFRHSLQHLKARGRQAQGRLRAHSGFPIALSAAAHFSLLLKRWAIHARLIMPPRLIGKPREPPPVGKPRVPLPGSVVAVPPQTVPP